MPVSVMPFELEFRSVEELSLDALATAVNRCFTGYFVPFHLDGGAIAQMLNVDSVDLASSLVVQRAGKIIGVALVARRGLNCRLAAMAIEPEVRGQRVGRALTEFVLHTARKRGDRRFTLEVIEQNEPGVRLYESAGFQRSRLLVGYSTSRMVAQGDSNLEETVPAEVSLAVARWGVHELPWQLSAQTLAALSPPHRAFRLGPASAAITNPDSATIVIRSLIVAPTERRRGWATRLCQALSAEFPGKKWRVPVWVPEEIPATFFTRLNFARESMTQIQMACDL